MVSLLSSFAYKTRRAKQYDKIANKFIKNEAADTVKEKDKLKLKDFGIVRDINKVRDFLPETIYKTNDKLNSMFSKAKKIEPALTTMQKWFAKEFAKQHSIIASINMSKNARLKGKGCHL